MDAKSLATKYKTILDNAGINTPLRLAHFFAQLDHESGLKPIEENLNYSGDRLLEVFPKYFNAGNVENYQWRPRLIAYRVYANRMGNGDEASTDGWTYRGRGMVMLTGKDNYRMVSDATGIDFLKNPDLLLTEANSMIVAIWFFKTKGLLKLADEDNIRALTKRLNGGYNGLPDRKRLLAHYKEVFK